jgi:hypothetical protein
MCMHSILHKLQNFCQPYWKQFFFKSSMPYIANKALKMQFQPYVACLIWKINEYTQHPQSLLPFLVMGLTGVEKENNDTLK